MHAIKPLTILIAFGLFGLLITTAGHAADDITAEKQAIQELTAKNLARSQMCASYRYDQDHQKDVSSYSKEQIESCAKADSDVLTMVQGVVLGLGLIVVGTVHFVAEAASTWANLSGCMAGGCGK